MVNDQELWNGLCRGDTVAFERFYQAHFRHLRNFLQLYLGSPQTAEDVAQDAFLQIWRRPNGFNPTKATLKAYLFGIARKRAADWWRQHQRSGAELSVQRPLPCEQSRMLIGDALAQLQAELRCLLWLREVEGYSYAELAEIVGIPLGTVRSRLFAAREELRRVWKGNPRAAKP